MNTFPTELARMYKGKKFLYRETSLYGFVERLELHLDWFLLSRGLNPKQAWDNHRFNFGGNGGNP